MFHLVYTSIAKNPFSDGELLDLVDQARKTNLDLGVTGLLLYQKDAFMQALEGEEAVVRTLYGAICNDARHHHVRTLVAKSIPSRQFADWSMGFRRMADESFRPVSGDSADLDQTPVGAERPTAASIALNLLGSFSGTA